jgi:hypothetical protein
MATLARIATDRDRPPNHERIVETLERVDPTTARALRAMVNPAWSHRSEAPERAPAAAAGP